MNLREQLIAFEGWKRRAYPDPLTGAEPYTIGVGHCGPEVKLGLVWTDEQIGKALDSDIAAKTDEVKRAIPWLDELNEPRQAVLLGMAFQLGTAGLLGFKNTLKAIKEGRYEDAHNGMLNSKWATQTHERATRLAIQMRDGEWA